MTDTASPAAPRLAPASPVVIFDRVHAIAPAGPDGRARGAITDLSISLRPGVHAFLGGPDDGTHAILAVLSGAASPRRGRLTIAGREPSRSPSLRARVGALEPEPKLPPAPTVRAAITIARRARGESDDRADAILDPFGLAPLAARHPRSLGFAEARAVELALALSTPSPLALALHEPLADLALPRPDVARARIAELAAAGACILITTSSPADARALADRVFVLHRGSVAREAGPDGGAVALATGVELCAWIAAPSDPGGAEAARTSARALAAAVARSPEVRGVAWEEASSPGIGPALVRIRGEGVEACARALIEAAVEADVTIAAIARTSPSLADVRAASDVLLRMRVAPRIAAPPPAPRREGEP